MSTTVEFGAALTTIAQVQAWIQGAAREFGDPSEPVCQLFFRWQSTVIGYAGDELACGPLDDHVVFVCGDSIYDLYRILVQEGDPTLTNSGELLAFGAVQIS